MMEFGMTGLFFLGDTIYFLNGYGFDDRIQLDKLRSLHIYDSGRQVSVMYYLKPYIIICYGCILCNILDIKGIGLQWYGDGRILVFRYDVLGIVDLGCSTAGKHKSHYKCGSYCFSDVFSQLIDVFRHLSSGWGR